VADLAYDPLPEKARVKNKFATFCAAQRKWQVK